MAMPVVPTNDVVCVQDPITKIVTVTYVLGDENNQEPAIITLDFETNVTGTAEGPWVSIGAKNYRDLGGAANRLVQAGTNTVTWCPQKGWPNHAVSAAGFRATVRVWTKDDPPDYLVIHLDEPYGQRFYTCEDALPGGIESDIYRRDHLVMRRIHAAGVTWRMGAPIDEVGRSGSLETPRFVTLTSDYYIGVFPFTLWQYCYVQRILPPTCTDEDGACALDTWSWNHARYGGADNQPESGKVWPEDKSLVSGSILYKMRDRFDLLFDYPTAAQWEYACRAGTTTPRFDGSSCAYGWNTRWDSEYEDAAMDAYAWYAHNSTFGHKRVGMKKPNPWGLYDMYGLVYEFCLDWADPSPSNDPITDPIGPDTGTERIFCGSAWNGGVPFLRSAVRSKYLPNVTYAEHRLFGFRVAAPLMDP